ncbi:hypothetical protein A1351_12325 [Methylosinus sp. R-45379]|uniref:LysR substrate-binding domain-containing protein n=1 Tax=Methylosinus sp. R-45379 TaxID=980563 RepID=UPI0007C98302|nr:LysR substrate-binding domain-containing protein [Methylosinus sp. R-45379]OAI28067.1 hypothetical protein A1351_12325 [Methylosinus sp. R-45379]
MLNIDTFGMTNLTTLVQMVSADMGCALLPEMSLPIETARGSVRVLRIEPPEPRRIIGLRLTQILAPRRRVSRPRPADPSVATKIRARLHPDNFT